jgi:Fe-S-cluster containining protein
VNKKEKKELLEELRRMIPSFSCLPGCHRCCGPVPFSKIEREAIEHKKRGSTEGLACAYECEEGCSIYEDRPIICRLFGVISDPLMQCSYGFMSETVLNKEQVDKMLDIYKRELMGDGDIGYL